MNEAQHGQIDLPNAITFSDYAELAASSAQYMEAPDPELVLRSGLIEEAQEVLETDPQDIDEFHKEIGDIIWYISQIAKFKGLSLGQVANARNTNFTTFSDFQASHIDSSRLPIIYSPDQEQLNLDSNPRELLAMGIIRVIDVLNPKMDELWQREERPALNIVLHDALSITAQISNVYSINLEEAARRTLHKIKSRPRNPHVIDHASTMKESLRERITSDPRVRNLLVRTAFSGNYDDHSKH